MKFFQKNKQGRGLNLSIDGPVIRLRIKDDYNNNDFELSLDEARGLRDALNKAIDKGDKEAIRELNQSASMQEPVESVGAFFNNEPRPEPEKKEFKLFDKEKKKPEFYY